MNLTHNHQLLNNRVPRGIIVLFLFFSLLMLYAPLSHGEEPFYSIALKKFNNEQDARKEESKLKNSGHNAFYRKEKDTVSGNYIYQVYIEKYASRDQAQAEAKVLKELELISAYKISEIKDTPQPGKPEEAPPVVNKPEPGAKSQTAVAERQAPEPKPKESEKKPEPKPEQAGPAPGPEVKAAETTRKPELPPAGRPEPAKQAKNPGPETNNTHDRLSGASLQVGAFKDKANAEELKIQLAMLGKDAFYRNEALDHEGTYYRLYITGYKSLSAAIKDAKMLLKSGVISGYSRVHSQDISPGTRQTKQVDEENRDKIYVLHISSDKKESNAKETVARFRKSGYRAAYRHEMINSEGWYRVYIGDFRNEAQARKKGSELLKKGIISYFKPVAINPEKLNY